MARILITSGPTRQYLDPVRYISNASSGQMGQCLVQATLDLGHEVILVSGPVLIDYPPAAKLIPVVSTEEMLAAATEAFQDCDGMIGAAAPCDYRPIEVADHKIRKTGEVLEMKLIETPDVVASLGANKRSDQWTVGFALETEDAHFRAITKLQRKCCDLVVLNGTTAINAVDNDVDIISPGGNIVESVSGSKQQVAQRILAVIQTELIAKHPSLGRQ
jgi:phosphopantothenoylcysteine decarboxylase/phosphopantothenate--cysteine ligase